VRRYFSPPFLAARAVGYGIFFFFFAIGIRRAVADPTSLRWFGPVGLISLVFLLHLLVVDWFSSLETGWHSTGFPLVWTTAQAIAGLAAATAAALLCRPDPEPNGGDGLDRGNLLLAALMAWAYVAFVEFLIIWSGNLPSETHRFRPRSAGGWQGLLLGCVCVEFVVPFGLLLSRRVKRNRRALGLVAVMLAGGQLAYTVWLMAPALPSTGPALLVAVVTAVGSLFLNRYLAGARQFAARVAS
jgi:hypothetical protein